MTSDFFLKVVHSSKEHGVHFANEINRICNARQFSGEVNVSKLIATKESYLDFSFP